jgi:NAD(P)H-quinone oxidoreductase subunit 2
MNTLQDYFTAWTALEPLLWVVGAILVSTLWNLFLPKHTGWTPVIGLLALAYAGFRLWEQFDISEQFLFGGVFTVDKLSCLFSLIAIAVGMVTILMTTGYEHRFGNNRGEFYTLILIAVASVMVLGGANDLIVLFVGLETLSLCCVILSGMLKSDRRSNEASLKYLLSTAATTATFLYGLSFVYGLTGSTNYLAIHEKLLETSQVASFTPTFMMVLLLSAIGFKLSLVPFHMWTPDVYQGAPTPVTAFLSIGAKVGGFAVAFRLLPVVLASYSYDWSMILAVLAMLSMIVGNYIALCQTSVKRMLAFSSIAHIGYMLIGLISGSPDGLSNLLFYLMVYGFMNLGAFAAVILIENELHSDNMNDFAGLIRKRPWLAIGLSVCLFNLAGLPVPPAGFLAKVFIFWSAVSGDSPIAWWLVICGLVTSVPAIYYYTRVVIKMVVQEPSAKVQALEDARGKTVDPQFWTMAALGLCIAGLCAGTLYVNQLVGLSSKAVGLLSRPPAIGMNPHSSINQ